MEYRNQTVLCHILDTRMGELSYPSAEAVVYNHGKQGGVIIEVNLRGASLLF